MGDTPHSMALSQEIERAREEFAHRAADAAHMRRELERLEGIIVHELGDPVQATVGLAARLAADYGDRLGPEGLLLLEELERSARHVQAVIERSH